MPTPALVWTSDMIAELSARFAAGESLDAMATALGCSQSSIKRAIVAHRIRTLAASRKRREAQVSSRWDWQAPSEIAVSCRMPLIEVRRIADRLDLGEPVAPIGWRRSGRLARGVRG